MSIYQPQIYFLPLIEHHGSVPTARQQSLEDALKAEEKARKQAEKEAERVAKASKMVPATVDSDGHIFP
jgi:hypothetical protein